MKTVLHRLGMAVGAAMIAVFGILLAMNITFIVQSMINPDIPPMLFNRMSFVTLSGSMSTEAQDSLNVGDLVVVKQASIEEAQTGDIITYKQDDSYITHRVVEVTSDEAGNKALVVKGDANEQADSTLVTSGNFVGILSEVLPGVGDFILFAQSAQGLFVLAVVPLLILAFMDLMSRRKEKREARAMLESMREQLKAAQEQLAQKA